MGWNPILMTRESNTVLIMENSWILFALAGMTALGLGDYIKKVVLSRWIHKEVFLLSCFFIYIPVFWILHIFFGEGDFQRSELVWALIIGTCNFFIPLGMLTAFKYLNMSFALVSIRLISSFLILWVWLYILSDVLSFYNIIWFFLGAFAIFLLSWFHFGEKLELHPKWIIAMFACTVWIVVSNSYFKYILPSIDIYDYMPLQFSITGTLIAIYMICRKKLQYFTREEFKKWLPFALLTWMLFLAHFTYFLPNIYMLGTLSLSYKMLSYSLIVPILLSVIFLWEPVNRTRLAAFILTLVSIFLFLV